VEAGKKAAGVVISLQKEVVALLRKQAQGMTAQEIATELGTPDQAESVCAILRHLAANPDRGVLASKDDTAANIRFSVK
jgi:glucose-6-phosphate isomerase